MRVFIADTFTKSLAKLSNQEKKAVKLTGFDIYHNPANPSLNTHKITRSKDPGFRSVRANRDIRIIIHQSRDSILICYADHHDNAYEWAERRRIETHPKTGAAQIVVANERTEQSEPDEQEFNKPFPPFPLPYRSSPSFSTFTPPKPYKHEPSRKLSIFAELSEDDLLDAGVPEDWIQDLLYADEDTFLEFCGLIPEEAFENLLNYTVTGTLKKADEIALTMDPFAHPDAQRRFKTIEDKEALAAAMNAPWEEWTIFLHPHQREIANRNFNGPARVCGSAGTGKTIVALHKTANLLKANPKARILLTTFSNPLAATLRRKIALLTGQTDNPGLVVESFDTVAARLFAEIENKPPQPASQNQIRDALEHSMKDPGFDELPLHFLLSEWERVIDPWNIDTLEAYKATRRQGRRARLGTAQRTRIWPVFTRTREHLQAKNLLTWPAIYARITRYFTSQETEKPFDHIIVDECQDLGAPELRMFANIADDTPNALFFAGDQGQRIFRDAFSWKSLGIDIRGRARTLKVNYRTSHQIRQAADRLLPGIIRDADGEDENRRAVTSIFSGPEPEIRLFDNAEQEIQAVALWIMETIEDGIEPREIGVVTRAEAQLPRARNAVKEAGWKPLPLGDTDTTQEEGEEQGNTQKGIATGTMYLAKGLEFKAVIVMACDEEALPCQERIETASDENELEQALERERNLFYVACTRARDRLLVSGVTPASEFLDDLAASP